MGKVLQSFGGGGAGGVGAGGCHDHESLKPSRDSGGAALMKAAPAVSTSDGHGQGLGSWQSSSLSPPLTVMGKGLGRGKALPCLHL